MSELAGPSNQNHGPGCFLGSKSQTEGTCQLPLVQNKTELKRPKSKKDDKRTKKEKCFNKKESSTSSKPPRKRSKKSVPSKAINPDVVEGENSDSDSWEDVPEEQNVVKGLGSEIGVEIDMKPCCSTAEGENTQSSTVEVHIESETSQKNKQVLMRELSKQRKEYQKNLHKVHLLCLLSGCQWLSELCNNETLRAVVFSLIPCGFVTNTETTFDALVLQRFLKWFRSAFQVVETLEYPTLEILLSSAESKTTTHFGRALLLVVALRGLGLDARFTSVVSPVPLLPEDLTPVSSKKQKKSLKTKAAKATESSSSPSVHEPAPEKRKESCNAWTEVYLDPEERWVVVDPFFGTIDDPFQTVSHCESKATYIIAVDNENALKDVTARYVQLTAAVAKQSRVDSIWWRQTLRPFKSKHSHRDRAEDLILHEDFCSAPLPTTLGDFKQHPLYVLEKDLKKYEAVYPPDTKPLGHFRGTKVFPRGAVYTLNSKEHWLKEARAIRRDEEPYKLVKKRAKPIQKGNGGGFAPVHETGEGSPGALSQEPMLPLYGFWQTEPYMAPPAFDGKVPRNDFGNVYLFKPSMLPPGTVHLHIPNLMTLAKKLGIDCAQAIVGWEFFGRGSHPTFDGFIVCEENAQVLIDAWDMEQSKLAEKEIQERRKRAVRNWIRVTKKVLLRNRIKSRFEDEPVSLSNSQETTSLDSDPEEAGCSKKADNNSSSALSWPQSKRTFELENSNQLTDS